MHNTQKNPHLLIKSEQDQESEGESKEPDQYKPAYLLEKDDYERYSRRDPNKWNEKVPRVSRKYTDQI